jgi:hypothetical protein
VIINREMHHYGLGLKHFNLGFGEGNAHGYVHIVLWGKKDAPPSYDELREQLLFRLADLMEGDPEFMQLLEQVKELKL